MMNIKIANSPMRINSIESTILRRPIFRTFIFASSPPTKNAALHMGWCVSSNALRNLVVMRRNIYRLSSRSTAYGDFVHNCVNLGFQLLYIYPTQYPWDNTFDDEKTDHNQFKRNKNYSDKVWLSPPLK